MTCSSSSEPKSGGVLLREENVESFEWDLTEFVKMMGWEHAVTVLTCKTLYSFVRSCRCEAWILFQIDV
jgi:hypothetical protein